MIHNQNKTNTITIETNKKKMPLPMKIYHLFEQLLLQLRLIPNLWTSYCQVESITRERKQLNNFFLNFKIKKKSIFHSLFN